MSRSLLYSPARGRTFQGIVRALRVAPGALTLDEAALERPPATHPVFRDVVVGVHKLERSLLLMLDVERTVTPASSAQMPHVA